MTARSRAACTRFEVPADFNAQRYLDDARGIPRGDLVAMRVVFARGLAPYIRERLWHPSQKLRDLRDGRVEMTLHVADTLEVRRWILGYGAEAEILQPERLREAVRLEAQALAARLFGRPLTRSQGRLASVKQRTRAIASNP